MLEAAAADCAESCVTVAAHAFGQFPNVTSHVVTPAWTASFWKRTDRHRVASWIAFGSIKIVTSGPDSSVCPLRSQVPFLFCRKSFAGPSGICPRIAEVHIDHRMICQFCRHPPVPPMPQEILPVRGRIPSGPQELLILAIGHLCFIHEEIGQSDRADVMMQGLAIVIGLKEVLQLLGWRARIGIAVVLWHFMRQPHVESRSRNAPDTGRGSAF